MAQVVIMVSDGLRDDAATVFASSAEVRLFLHRVLWQEIRRRMIVAFVGPLATAGSTKLEADVEAELARLDTRHGLEP